MAIDFGGNDIGGSASDKQDQPYSAVPLAPRLTLPANSLVKPTNPNLPLNQPQVWRNTQTGETFTGQLAANDPTKLIIGFSRGNPQNTTSIDINTGQKAEADPHPMRDALLHELAFEAPLLVGAAAPAFAGGGGAGAGASGAAGAGGSGGAAASTAGASGAGAGAGGGAAATTGGILSAFGKWSPLASLGAQVVGGIEQGRLAGKQADAQQAAFENQQAIRLAEDQAAGEAAKVNQQMAQKQLQAGDYQRNYRNAVMAGLMDPTTGVQDINFNLPDRISSHMGTVTGGLRPSAFGNRGEISSIVGPQALEALKHNPTTNDLLPPAGSVSPNLTPYPTSSGVDNTLGGISLGLSALSALPYLWPRPASSIAPGMPLTPNPPMSGVSFGGSNPSIYTVPGATNPRAFQGVSFY